MKHNPRIILVGAGLSGLYLAYLLKRNGVNCTLLEASDRLGGRIQTLKGPLETPLEIGATWFSDMHENLLSLVDELDLQKFSQFAHGISMFQTKSFEPAQQFFIPEAEPSSYRLAGGTTQLIEKLSGLLDDDRVLLNWKVVSIEEDGDDLNLYSASGRRIRADKVVLCMPPQLISSAVAFSPNLPIGDLLPSVQTWMAGSIKFALEYERPFWRDKGYSGMLYSHAGIITEMYDHSNSEHSKFAFTGFLNPAAAAYSQHVREELVLGQLVELFGEEAKAHSAYFDKVWNDEFILQGSPVIQRPHQHNGHPDLQQSYMHQKLFFCGTETSPICAGYMEGAIISAKRTLAKLLP